MRWSPPREALPSGRVERNDWKTLRTLLPYLWAYKGRVLFALACLVAAKLATVSVPILLKDIVDGLSPSAQAATGLLVVPLALVIAYGA
jgi:ABC-type multidrug transport system fused ATPase/permease subunit